MGSVNGSEGPWLQRFANGKPVRKRSRQQPWKTFSFLYTYPEVLLSTSRVAQPVLLIAADILGRKILPKAAPDQSRDIIASVQCILDRENFVREVDRYLRHSDFLDLRRTEILYKKYLEDVSEPLMQKLKDQVDSQSEEEVRKRRREQFSQYLNYCTKKGYVFLEHYDPSEYDPFFQKTCTDCWKVMEVIKQRNDRENQWRHLSSS